MTAPNGDWPDDRVATFRPKRTDDLQHGAHLLVGKTLKWRYMGTMDEGPYEGQRIWLPVDHTVHTGWVPDCDLEDVP